MAILSFAQNQSASKKDKEEEEPTPRPNAAASLNQILDSGQDGLDTLAFNGLRLGIRASMPKMPSFKVRFISTSAERTVETYSHVLSHSRFVVVFTEA